MSFKYSDDALIEKYSYDSDSEDKKSPVNEIEEEKSFNADREKQVCEETDSLMNDDVHEKQACEEEFETDLLVSDDDAHENEDDFYKSFTWYPTQALATDNWLPEHIVIARDLYGNKGNKEYGIIDQKKLQEFIEMTPETKICSYEMMIHTENLQLPCKYYVDYDLNGKYMSDEEKEILMNEITKYIIDGFKKLGYTITHDNFLIENSSYDDSNNGGKSKTSLHVKVLGYHFQNFSILKHLKNTILKNTLFKIISATGKPLTDPAVYTVNRCFRLPLCAKRGSNRYLKIITDHTFEDAILTPIPEDSILVNVDLDALKIPKQPRCTDLILE